jgi:hypothetical protein
VRYDPGTNTATAITVDANWPVGITKDYCVFNNELYGIGPNSSGTDSTFSIKRLVGNQFVQVQTLSTQHRTHQDSDLNAGHCLFTDGTDMFAFMSGKDVTLNIGSTAVRLVPNGATFTESNITIPVVPPSLRIISSPNHYWHSFLDNDTDPENPAIIVWTQAPSGVSDYNAWQWNGYNAAMTNLGPAGAAGIALPHTKDGGGEYIWTQGEPSVEITDISPSVDSQTVSFIAYSSEVTTTFKVRLWYSGGEDFAKSPATLIGPVTGGGVLGTDTTGDFIDDVTADGVTVNTVVWDVVADGFAKGSQVILMPAISL